MLKRFFAMILVITTIMCLCAGPAQAEAESPDSAAFETFTAANTAREILARHGNAQATRTTWFDGAVVLTEHSFRTADFSVWNYGDGRVGLRKSDCFLDCDSYDGVLFGATIFDSAEDCAAAFKGIRDQGFFSLFEGETLEKTYVTDDGHFVAETRCSNPVIVRQTLGETEYTGSYVYAEGMELVYRYTFDRETLDLVRLDFYIVDAEGNSKIYQSETYEYGVETPDPAVDSELFADYFAALSVQENLRTIRIVYDPGTEHEKTAEAALPVNTWFNAYHNGAYIQKFFSDRECTRAFDERYVREDLVLYALSE